MLCILFIFIIQLKMERLDICRICSTVNVSHLIPDTQLQEVYEKLTSLSFQNPMKPSLMCYICRAQLYRAHRLMLQCLKAERSFTQIFNQLLASKGQVQQESIEIDCTKVTPLNCTAVQHIDIEPHMKEQIPIIYGEDVTHVKTEVESVEEISDDIHQVSDHSLDNKHTYFDSEYYMSLNYVKENADRVTDQHNIARIVKKERIGWMKDEEEETQTNKNEVNKFKDNTGLIKREVTDDHEKTSFECSIETKASIFCEGITDTEINDLQNGGNKSENKSIMESLVVNESDASNIERDDKNNVNLMISNINLSNVTSDHRHDKGSDMENFKQCKITQNNNRNCKSSSNFFTHAKDETRFICDICRRNFSCKSELVRHVHIHTGDRPYSCKICDKRFTTKSHLKSHELIHTGEKPYSCEICDKKFAKNGNLKIHKRIHTGERPYSCEICDKKFATKNHLKSHELLHTGEKPYSCEICDKKFAKSGNLKIHERMHTGERPYICKICDMRFATTKILKTHEHIHTGERPYICKICDKGFTNRSNLKAHEYIHNSEKPYSCKICDKRFTNRSNLKSHERVHNSERPYSCKICDKRFTNRSNLKSHERVHSSERPYSCKICDKQFSYRSNLKSHEHIHNSERPYSCKICDKKFTNRSYLKSHERIHNRERPCSCHHCHPQSIFFPTPGARTSCDQEGD